MDIASFEDLVDRHGGDPSRWPRGQREAAAALLAISPAARALLAEMQVVEAMLRRPAAAPDADAIDAVAARASRHRQETRAWRLAVRAGVGTAAAAVLVLGVLVGGLLPSPGAHDTLNPDRVLAAALGGGGTADVD